MPRAGMCSASARDEIALNDGESSSEIFEPLEATDLAADGWKRSVPRSVPG